jgi:glycosyltransferase involved in cell wall biosynthesis
MIHVCIVSCQHSPDDVRVTHKEAMSFRQAGFRVTWVGPRRLRKGDDYGVDFRYYPLGIGRVGRLLHYRQARRVALSVDDVDVFFAVEPDSAVVASHLARRYRAAAIFDIHEIYHDEMLGRWAKGVFRKLLSECVRRSILKTCRRCDSVVAVSDATMAPYASVSTPHIIVRNCAPVSFADGGASDVCSPSREHFTVMHGKFAHERGTEAVLRAAAMAAQSVPNLRLVMFEGSSEQFQADSSPESLKLISQHGARNVVDLRPTVPMHEMTGILRTCDAGLIAYDRTWGIRSLPNRLFEYMAAGLPVIAPVYADEIRKIVERERCGLLVDCEQPADIAAAFVHLQKNPAEAIEMGRRGLEAFLSRHNWEVEVKPLVQRIRELAANRQAR